LDTNGVDKHIPVRNQAKESVLRSPVKQGLDYVERLAGSANKSISLSRPMRHNDLMNTLETKTDLPSDLQEDTDALLAHFTSGEPLDPQIRQRIRERGDRNRERIFREQGLLDIGTPAIREFRHR
jgi:hypothetical protein